MIHKERRRVISSSLIYQSNAKITAVALSSPARAFFGMDDGLLEECEIVPSSTRSDDSGSLPLVASVVARKPLWISKHHINRILPAISANCLVILCSDGSLRLVHSDTLESRVALKGPVFGVAVTEGKAGRLPRIALAYKTGLYRHYRISIHDIIPEGGCIPTLKHRWSVDAPGSAQGQVSLAWSGDMVVCGFGSSYFLAWRSTSPKDSIRINEENGEMRELFVGPNGAPTFVVSLPHKNCALIVTEGIGILINSIGEPIGNPLQFERLDIKGIMNIEDYVLVISSDGIHVFDLSDGKEIQVVNIQPNDDIGSSFEDVCHFEGMNSFLSEAGIISSCKNVWIVKKIQASLQAKELMEESQLEDALEIIEKADQKGEEWVEAAYGDIALLFLQDGRIKEGIALLDRCIPSGFDPTKIFDLFPEYTHSWIYEQKGLVPSLRSMITEKLGIRTQDEIAEILMESKSSLVAFLFRAREFPHVEQQKYLDTLLMHLLIDLNQKEQVSAFSSMPNHIDIELVSDRLLDSGWQHALATLYAGRGAVKPALNLWHVVIDSSKDTNQEFLPERKEALEGVLGLFKDRSVCSVELIMQQLLWMVKNCASEPLAETLAFREDMQPSTVLSFLENGSNIRWQYLSYIINGSRSALTDDAHLHTEFAKAMIEAIFCAAPELKLHETGAHDINIDTIRTQSMSCEDDKEEGRHKSIIFDGKCQQKTRRATLVGSLANYGTLNENNVGDYDSFQTVRKELKSFLENSSLWDQDAIMQLLEKSSLYEELVVARWRAEDHTGALYLLVHKLHNIKSAVTYASEFMPPQNHHILLSLVLHPQEGREPIWEDAAYVVANLGQSLNPLDIMIALPSDTPIQSAFPIFAPLLKERIARRRNLKMRIGLHRAQSTRWNSQRVDAEKDQVVINSEQTCRNCGLRIGVKVFVAMPKTSRHSNKREIMCFNCMKIQQDKS